MNTTILSTNLVPEDKKKLRKSPFFDGFRSFLNYSISIVPGGLLVQSYITLFTPLTSLTIRFVTMSSISHGRWIASAVMKSVVPTARSATAKSYVLHIGERRKVLVG